MKTFVQTVILVLILGGGCKTTTTSRIVSESDSQIKAVAQQPEGITERYWKLIELNGKPVVLDASTGGRNAFIILKIEENRVNGNTGCNTLTGAYEIDPTRYRIRFLQMAVTLKACMNMEVENELKRVLELVDNYAMSADEKYLGLNRARISPLALFEAVYMRYRYLSKL